MNQIDLTNVTQVQEMRKYAARCRDLARSALSDAIAGELERIAAEFERDAATIETRVGPGVGSAGTKRELESV